MPPQVYGWAAAIFGLLFIGLSNWMQRSQAQSTGAALEAGKVSEVSAKAEVAIADAQANAPRTRQQLLDSLKDGSF